MEKIETHERKENTLTHTAGEIGRKIKIGLSYLGRVPLWVFPLLVSLLFFQIRGVQISPDAALYIARGLNLYRGRGYLESDWSPALPRGPVFPGLVAASFYLLGVSVKSALWVVRFFFVLNVGLIYAIGARFFNRATGLAAALLVLTSFVIHRWSSHVLLDNVISFFVLLSYLLLFIAFEKGRNLYLFGAAGFVLGVAFLVKQIAGLFWPLAALMWILSPDYRRGKSWRGALVFTIVALAIIVFWTLYGSLVTGGGLTDPRTVMRLFGPLLASAGGGGASTSSFALLRWLSEIWLWLRSYYEFHFSVEFPLAPLSLLAWAYVIIRAIVKRSRAEVFLASGLLLFSPIILLLGKSNARTGQSLYLFLLSYLAIARLLWVVESDVLRYKVRGVIGVALILLAIAAQVWAGDKGFIHFLKDVEPSGFVAEANVYTMSFGRDDWEVTGWNNQWVQEAGEWLKENVSPDESILADWYWADSLYFHLDAQQPVHLITYVSSLNVSRSHRIPAADAASLVPILFVWPNAGTVNPRDLSYLHALSEPEFLDQINELGVKYVVVTPRRNFLSLYLRASPGFEETRQFGDGQIQIFKVRGQVSSIAFPICAEPATFEYMRRAARNNPSLYKRLIEEYFEKKLGWTKTQLEAFMNGNDQFVPVKVNQIYSWQSRARTLFEAHRFEAAVAAYERAIELEPDNVQLHVELAQAYQANGQPDRAMAQLEAAILLSPDSDAIEHISRYLDIDPMYLLAYLALGENYQAGQNADLRDSEWATHSFLGRLDLDASSGNDRQVRRSAFVIGRQPRGVLFQHPPSQIAYRLDVPASAHLKLSLALSPEVWQPGKGDGVQFDITIDDGHTKWHPFSEYIDPKNIPAHRQWHDREIVLSPWAGQTVTITFATGPGPNGNSDYDWAGWGEPRVVQPIAYNFLAELPDADQGGADESQVRQDTLIIDYEPRAILFQHPSNRVTYRIEVPQRAGLHFGLGMDPAVWSPDKGDGVEYNIYVRYPDEPLVLRRVFHHYLDPKSNPEDRHWLDQVVDLSGYGGQTVDVIFEALPGPAGDANFDWGGWSMPVLVGDDMALLNADSQVTASVGGDGP